MKNRVQFQRGLSLSEFMDRYGTEAKCEAALAEQRWPSGLVCPRCQDDRHSCFERGHQRLWQCHRCHHQVSITAGTIFENTKLPLTKWFLAMFFMTQFKNNISALCLKRHLGGSHHTARSLKHKLMTVMGETEANRELAVRVEIDDAYLGGARAGKAGRGSANKVPFVAAVETTDDGRPRYVRFDPMPFTHECIDAWASQSLAPTTHALSDALPSFSVLADSVRTHEAIVVGSGRQAAQHPSSVGSIRSSRISRPPCRERTIPSASPNTPGAISPNTPTASIVASICAPSWPASSITVPGCCPTTSA